MNSRYQDISNLSPNEFEVFISDLTEIKVEPRILIHRPELDYGDSDSENMLIHGDNLLALKALEKQFANEIKCIYIVIHGLINSSILSIKGNN